MVLVSSVSQKVDNVSPPGICGIAAHEERDDLTGEGREREECNACLGCIKRSDLATG